MNKEEINKKFEETKTTLLTKFNNLDKKKKLYVVVGTVFFLVLFGSFSCGSSFESWVFKQEAAKGYTWGDLLENNRLCINLETFHTERQIEKKNVDILETKCSIQTEFPFENVLRTPTREVRYPTQDSGYSSLWHLAKNGIVDQKIVDDYEKNSLKAFSDDWANRQYLHVIFLKNPLNGKLIADSYKNDFESGFFLQTEKGKNYYLTLKQDSFLKNSMKDLVSHLIHESNLYAHSNVAYLFYNNYSGPLATSIILKKLSSELLNKEFNIYASGDKKYKIKSIEYIDKPPFVKIKVDFTGQTEHYKDVTMIAGGNRAKDNDFQMNFSLEKSDDYYEMVPINIVFDYDGHAKGIR